MDGHIRQRPIRVQFHHYYRFSFLFPTNCRTQNTKFFLWHPLCEICPNTEFFLVRIFPHSGWIRRDRKHLSVFSPNAWKYGPEKTPYLDTFHVVSCKLWRINMIMLATTMLMIMLVKVLWSYVLFRNFKRKTNLFHANVKHKDLLTENLCVFIFIF